MGTLSMSAGSRPSGKSRKAHSGVAVAAASAAAGLLAGLAAANSRRAAQRAAEALTGDWLDLLRAEQLVAMELLDDLTATRDDEAGRRGRLLAKLKAVLDKHAFQKEAVIYPALRLADPAAPVDRLFARAADLKVMLHVLETTPKGGAEWLNGLKALGRAFEDLSREEGETVLPAFHARLSDDEIGALTTLMVKQGARLV